MRITRVGSPAALAAAVADRVAETIGEAVAARGRATVAFSGGSTPRAMLGELAQREVDWDRVTVFQVDERVAPDGHPDRNATLLVEQLLSRVPATAHLMPVTDEDLQAAAGRYAKLLSDACDGVLDLVHLGLGADGHTASLLPGDPVLAVRDRDVSLAGPADGRLRMTLTYSAIDRAEARVWEVSGAAKSPAVAALLAGGDIPAARVRRDGSVLLLDAAAAEAAR